MPPKQRAAEKAARQEDERDKKTKDVEEKKAAAEWSVGAKDNSKDKAKEDKEMEKVRKAAEKVAILAAEEEELSGVKRVVKTKKKGKDDFDLLNAALAAAPKSKAQKDADLKKKADEERKKKEEEARELKAARLKAEEDAIRKAAARGIVVNHTDDLMILINNRLEDDDFEHGSGLDGAIDVLSLGGGRGGDGASKKALYNAFYEAKLPVLKEDLPGLKLSQYKDRIFDLWKKSPENPDNQPRRSLGAGAAADF